MGFPGESAPAVLEMQFQSVGEKDALEEEMATYTGILAWRSPWTEEPAKLQFMGSQRAGHK